MKNVYKAYVEIHFYFITKYCGLFVTHVHEKCYLHNIINVTEK